MDGTIRILLQSCVGRNSLETLRESYEKLKREGDGNRKSSVGTDLFVLCAEIACLVSHMLITAEIYTLNIKFISVQYVFFIF